MGKFTVECAEQLCQGYFTPKVLMSDNSSHFDCKEVANWATSHGVSLIHTPAYAPWTNGLVEDANRLLLDCLHQFCNPDVIPRESSDEEKLGLTVWPKHLPWAVELLNNCVLPSLKYSPREILLGMILHT
jgi:transposase InsO family protein